MKRLNFNIKDRKILYMILGIVFISVFTLTVAYAALNAVLTIQGSAQVSSADWDVHFDNVKVTSGSVSGDDPVITSPTTATFSTTLNMPGEFYEFLIDVVNDGSIDAMIENITKTPTLTSEQAKYLKYDITYQNGETITTKQLVEKESFVRLKVRLEYRNDLSSSDLPTSSETLNLGLQLDYTQSDGRGSVVNNGGISSRIVSGDIETVGSEICFDTECFYVIGTEGDNVKLLGKYNLYVGRKWSGNSYSDYGSEATGLQDSRMLGRIDSRYVGEGIVDTFSSVYWSDTVTEFPAYIYGEKTDVYSYIEFYKSYLKSINVYVDKARVISYEELIELGCSDSSSSCADAPSWVYSTSYWVGSANAENKVWIVSQNKNFKTRIPSRASNYGVRPVIVVSKSNF